MSTIEVVEVESASQLRKFIAYPNELYKDDPNYVAPLTSERLEFFDFKKNPFYRSAKAKLFLARRNGQIAGRIATCVNFNHNEFHGEQTGFFGFFDCPDNHEIASMLLKVAMITLKREGMEKMRGPMSFSTNHECGFLIEGFDSPPVVMMPYNQPYLPKLAERFGLKKAMDLLAYKLISDDPIPERVQTVADRMRRRAGITLRSINMSDFDNEARRINSIYRDAWEKNWGFVPMTEEEFFHMARQLKQIIDPNLVIIAEHEGKPVAFSLAVPDVNQALIHLNGKLLPVGLLKLLWHTKIRNKIKGARIIMLGVMPRFQKRGIDSMLYVATYQRGVERGYTWAELSWILETNDLMRRGAEQLGAKMYKRYRIVEMPL
ncbi:MAG: GNAT family N-acetyltransferase [Candidatus Zixiibacteriota bacterium]|nr:MAG: GNAT family N-acetyltransferase [candidate division Zixibacteria bacterium]